MGRVALPHSLPALSACVIVGACVSGCEGVQSALDPAGPIAREIAALWWWMAGVGTGVFALVLVLLLYAVFRNPELRWRVGPERLIVIGGVAFPVVVLSLLLPFGLSVGSGATAPRSPDTLTIRVRGHQWWWDIEYDSGTPGERFTTANELYLPVGQPVEFILTSVDVIHSLWLPKLAGKLDLIPGRTNRLMVEADEPGVFRGQCAEFCGVAHTKMALHAVAVPPDEFERWAENQRSVATAPSDASTREGAELFQATGCVVCHTVRGHGAWGRAGPDLTHVGSRMTIGAGVLAMTAENLALWIGHNDALKPGNRMPDFVELDLEDRNVIGAYLESLE